MDCLLYFDGVVTGDFRVEVEPILRRAHLNTTATPVETKELVGLRMRFQPDVEERA
jgi:hypothetical protein